MKILEIVRMNDGFGFVVDEAAPLVYHEEFVFDQAFKRTEHMLIGESADGRMNFLVHHNYGSMKAFAGRELTIQMEDGNQRTIKDVWWSEGSSAWAAEHGVELRGFSYGTLDGMIDRCVFVASIMRAERLQELINEFYEMHPNYSPWDYAAWHKHCRTLRKVTFKRASEIQITLRRIDKIIEATSEQGRVVINGEHVSIKHPLGAAVLEAIYKYRSQLIDEFNSL